MRKAKVYSISAAVVGGAIALSFHFRRGDPPLNDTSNGNQSKSSRAAEHEKNSPSQRDEEKQQRPTRDPAKAGRLKEKFSRLVKSDKPYNYKTQVYCELVSEMAQCMPASEIIAFIDETIGQGGQRGGLITTLFGSTPGGVDELATTLKTLQGEDALNAQAGVYDNLAKRKDFREALEEFIASYPDLDISTWRVSVGLDLTRQPPGAKKQHFEDLMRMRGWLPESKRLDYLKVVCRAGSLELPFDAKKSISELEESGEIKDETALREMKDMALQKMLESSPQKTVTALLGEQTTDIAALERGMRYWLNSEPKAFETWFEENKGNFSDTQLESYRSASVTSALDQKDLAKARSLAAEISDPAVKDQVTQRICDAEEKEIAEQTQRNPGNLLTSMASGGTAYQDASMETAVVAWGKADPQKLGDWYQQNWDALSASKRQYVAAGMARVALEKGDVQTARQWADEIADAATKSRVEAAIARSTTGK